MNEQRSEETTTEPAVAVVLPTRDRRDALQRCLDSLATQTHPSFEIVVIDDCSSDGTPTVLQQFSDTHPDLTIRWMRNDTNTGTNRSRNRGIRDTRAELVAFIDSDCVATPDWLERLTRPFSDPCLAAVTGSIEMPPPSNVFELTYHGTNRVVDKGYVNRLVACNMCIRRHLLLEHPLDEDLKYGCDEEGIYLRLRAAGFSQRFVADAHVRHEHRHSARSLLRQARRGGAGAAWLVYKYHLPPRLDLLGFMLAYFTLPLALLDFRFAALSAFFFAGALAAITYNDLFRKRKTVGETLRSFPVLLVYYHVRLVGYVVMACKLRLGKHDIQRVRLRPSRGNR